MGSPVTEFNPPLVGTVIPLDAEDPDATVNVVGYLLTPGGRELNILRLLGLDPPPPPPPKQSFLSRLARLCRRWFLPFDPNSIPVGRPLTEEQVEMLNRHRKPGYFMQLAIDRKITMDCLHHYNLEHPGNEYEPAPGKVIRNFHFHYGMCWTHGNFVARKKRPVWLSFLPAPRTLFFFERAHSNGINAFVTCTPLDEPVTESYSVLGFPLGSSTRRSGKFDSFCKTCESRFDVPVDSFCKTCESRFDVPHPSVEKKAPCGHEDVQKVCEMCYHRSPVLHPSPGEFAFGYRHPYRPYPTKH